MRALDQVWYSIVCELWTKCDILMCHPPIHVHTNCTCNKLNEYYRFSDILFDILILCKLWFVELRNKMFLVNYEFYSNLICIYSFKPRGLFEFWAKRNGVLFAHWSSQYQWWHFQSSSNINRWRLHHKLDCEQRATASPYDFHACGQEIADDPVLSSFQAIITRCNKSDKS